MLRLEDLKLVRRTGDWEDREVTYGRRRLIRRALKSYDVFGPDGAQIGIVGEEMTTFEQRTPGRRYVNSRWQSPRWYFYVGSRRDRRSFERLTRKDALEDLLREIKNQQREEALL